MRRRQWHPTPVLLPGKSHGWRSLVGCSPWGREESDTTEWLHFHFSLSCVGEGNGNPLQCSCLENPRDGGAWWAAVYGVTQSRTRLTRLSISSSSVEIGEKQTEGRRITLRRRSDRHWACPERRKRYYLPLELFVGCVRCNYNKVWQGLRVKVRMCWEFSDDVLEGRGNRTLTCDYQRVPREGRKRTL